MTNQEIRKSSYKRTTFSYYTRFSPKLMFREKEENKTSRGKNSKASTSISQFDDVSIVKAKNFRMQTSNAVNIC